MLPEQLERGIGVSGQFLKQAPDTTCRGATVCHRGKKGLLALAVVFPNLYDVNHGVSLL